MSMLRLHGYWRSSAACRVRIALVPQLYSAERFGIDLSAFPGLVAVGEKARALVPFAAAHPSIQPDADPQ